MTRNLQKFQQFWVRRPKLWMNMMRYYFDLRDGDDLAPDEEGMELRSMERVQQEAAKTLADMVRDAILEHLSPNGFAARRMAIEVRNDCGPVLQARFSLEMGGASLRS